MMKSNINMEEVPKVQYLPCNKTGYHYGEVLNMLCLEPQCHAAMLCCCACVEEQHKNHNTKPLRLVLLQAAKSSKSIVPVSFDIGITLEKLNSHEKITGQLFKTFKIDILTRLDQIQHFLKDFYSNLTQQVKLKNMDPKVELEKAFKIIQSSEPKPQFYIQSIQRVASLISAKKENNQLSQAEINSAVQIALDGMKKTLKSSFDQLLGRVTNLSKVLYEQSKVSDVWLGGVYKFNPKTKHSDIKIINDVTVKCTNSSGYKFAIMDPSLETGQKIKEMGFKIKESGSNWIAVGMCHKKIVISKNYGFNFSSIGHGAYMISANGGSWSNTKADQNNNTKSFKFVKGDIISVRVDFNEKTAIFKKGNDKYTLNFSTLNGDELYPCVLFYYLNDQIEYLPSHKF